jgi:hypothetical protein
MRRLIFAVVVLGSAPAAARAQRVPARDLLDLPLGTVAEPMALAGTVGDGLWNPATTALTEGTRARIALAALTTPAAQGVGAQALSGVVGFRRRTTVGIGIARASMRDIQRTGTDPQTLGEIRYSTTVASVTATHQWPWVAGGVAARYRTGEIDLRQRATLGLDVGVLGRLPQAYDLRVAVSTYMWTFGATRDDRPALAAAADVRLVGTSELRELRSGYSLVATRALGRDDYLHLGGRSGRWTLRGGVLRATNYDVVTWGSRLGVGLQHARYTVGFSREERDTGLPPSYQFTLTTSFK